MQKPSFLVGFLVLFLTLLCHYAIASAEDPSRDPFFTEGERVDVPQINTVHESIDPFSGILTLIHNDLHLPGNGGLDLNLFRTYKSMIWGRHDVSNPGLVAVNEKSTLGIGWTMHMGIVKNPAGKGSSNRFLPDNPVFILPDGSSHIFYRDKNDSTRLISKDFWIYKNVGASTYEVTTTDGTVYTVDNGATAGYNIYDGETLINIGQVIKIRNAASTAQISITYSEGLYFHSRIDTITDSANRVITFNYNTDYLLSSITVDNRTFNYEYTTINGQKYLTTATPPVGNPWTYEYDTTASTYELIAINYPTGGRIAYTYGEVTFATGATNVGFRVIASKTTSGRGISGGDWTYSYSSGGTGGDTTTISAPGGVTETHKFYGWGNTGNNNVWKVGLPMSKTYSGAFSLSEAYTWTQGTQISRDEISNAGWTGTLGFVYDMGIYVPFLSSKSITRDGKAYTTNYDSYDVYGNPQSISESGDGTRSRTLTYWTNATNNIVRGKPATESVTGTFAGTASTSWTYDDNSGNVTQTTKDGVTTSYAYNATTGNLSSVTDANNRTLSYLWTNGRVSRETNPYYNISRTINSNGTVASETNGRGYTTSFLYDGNLRPTRKTPPTGNITTITYPVDSSYRRETRGSYYITYNFDGFGRPSGSSDTRGVTTTIAYTPYGTKSYEDTNIGDKINYDYFGRVKQIVHKDNTTINYAYSNSNVTITEENSGSTLLTHTAFGNPDEKYLVSARDQAGTTTSYTRNIQGNVTAITQGAVTRSFGYNTTKKNFLVSETNPETGTITYSRDNVGTLTGKTDSSGTTTYSYDTIYRLTGISAGGSSIGFGYDNANNRTSMTYPSGSATYTYDAANRMTQKAETISGRSYATGYGYDGNDNNTTLTYPSGRIVTYVYNGNNQATSITGFGGAVNSIAYNTAGLPTTMTLSNGLTETFGYNTRYLTTSIVAGSAINVSYGYDTRGNTTSYTNSLDTSKNQAFGYDSLSRLTSFSGSWGSGSFAYDATGNRSTKTVGGYSTTYTYANNRVTSTSGQEPASYSYNGEGLLTGGTWDGLSHALNYDSFDNLTGFQAGGTTLASFAYDGDNQRVSKTANGKTTVYHYNQQGNVIAEDDGSGNLIADTVFLNGKLIAKVSVAPDTAVTPSNATYGTTYVNSSSPAQAITVSNTSLAAKLLVGTISLSGSNPSDFIKTTDNCSGKTLVAGTNCTVAIVFRPASAGSKSATLNIPSDDPDTPNFAVTLNGNAVDPILTIAKGGTGGGLVTSSPSGISCGTVCSSAFVGGSTVTLQAITEVDSSFAGWSGGQCTGTGSCAITLATDTTVNANFAKLPSLTLASGVVGISYTASLPTTGGRAPFTWSKTAGALPDGLILDESTGTVSGIPTSPGSSLFAFKVTDADNMSSSFAATLEIKPALELAVTPLQMDADSIASVSLTVTNRIVPGGEVLVEQLIDIDGDGIPDPSDTSVIRSFKIIDGVSSMIPSAPGDEDATVDGSIATHLQHLVVNDIHHAPGRYILRVSSGDAKAEVPFIVNPVSRAQAVAGQVTDGTNPVPGAIVRLVDQWRRDIAFAIADSSGQYLLYVKDPGVYAVIPHAYGYAFASAAYSPFTLSAGQNITDRNLTLATGTHHVSGMVKDAANGAGIAGIWVKADGTTHSGIAVTDRNGNYDILLPSGQYDISIDTGMFAPNPFLQGYTGFDRNSVKIDLTANIAAVDFTLPKASVFVSGRVTDEIGLGISGIAVQGKVPSVTDAREPVGTGASNANGDYVLGIYPADNWTLFINNAAAELSGYIGPVKPNFSTSANPLTNNDFILRRITSWVQGTVKDSNNNLLGNIEVTVRNPDFSVVSSITTDSNGFYRLGVYAGSWHLDALVEKKGYANLAEQTLTVNAGDTGIVDFVVDVTPPIGTVTINAAAPSTASPDVTLNLVCNDNTICTAMQFSNDNTTWTDPVPFTASRLWSLTSGDGAKTVHVRFMDAAGNSATANATVLLDTTPPATVASLPGGSYNTVNTIALTCGDGMGAGCDKIRYTTDGTAPNAASPLYTAPITVSTTTLKYYATDLVGNSEPVRTQIYILDTIPPTGGVTIGTGTGSTTVTLNLTCNDPSGCAQMQFSNDGVTWSTPESYQPSKVWETASDEGDRTIYIRLMDSAGNWSTSVAQIMKLRWNGVNVNSILDLNAQVAPVDTIETFEQHFISRGWATPQDQVDAGYPLFIQPTPATAHVEETRDLGSLQALSNISLDLAANTVLGSVNITPSLSVSPTGLPGTWSDYTGSYQVSVAGFRFVRIMLDLVATGGGITEIRNPLLRIEPN